MSRVGAFDWLRNVRLDIPAVGPKLMHWAMRSAPLTQLPMSESSQGFYQPIRIRPVLLCLNVLVLVLLGLLGFHPSAQEYVYVNDKVMHFLGFLLASFLTYMIWDLDENVRRIRFWRYMPLAIAFVASVLVGAIGSEFVQSLLPYKTFQIGDVLANLAGSGIGLYTAYHFERGYRARRETEAMYLPIDMDSARVEGYSNVGDWDTSIVDHAQNSPHGWTRNANEAPLGDQQTNPLFLLEDEE
ncbi:hypothetical protein MYAM1_000314 [Malassezia yamatoensis]|uniref:VanZ-like domain-containing protein n=1 Tax=Malassezia yamatoensis TaxID=253288 RepID=A0AAJ5YWE5_9BASI|nr:hypothetical protein MYAM1_000314 [Malassezia yamatoensis]